MVKSDFEVEGGGVIKQGCNEAHTRRAAPTNTGRFFERVLGE